MKSKIFIASLLLATMTSVGLMNISESSARWISGIKDRSDYKQGERLMAICNDGKISVNVPGQAGKDYGRCNYHGGVKYNCNVSEDQMPQECRDIIGGANPRITESPNSGKWLSGIKSRSEYKKGERLMAICNDGKISVYVPGQAGKDYGRCNYHGGVKYNCNVSTNQMPQECKDVIWGANSNPKATPSPDAGTHDKGQGNGEGSNSRQNTPNNGVYTDSRIRAQVDAKRKGVLPKTGNYDKVLISVAGGLFTSALGIRYLVRRYNK